MIRADVQLIVYDLDGSAEVFVLNQMLRPLGTGVFHCGVQVLNQEWSFRGSRCEGTGVFCCQPRTCANLTPREVVPLGSVLLPEGQVETILEQMKHEWPGRGYNVLRRNCGHFCKEFSQRLGVGPLPIWVTNLASTGADLATIPDQVKSLWSGLVDQLPDFTDTSEDVENLNPGSQPLPPRVLVSRSVPLARAVARSATAPTLLTTRTVQEPSCVRMQGTRGVSQWQGFDAEEEVVQCCF
eukprot:CAMPEP_0181469516 /NCGR_PEP_ID=MMETSP1110-20121109/38058_1 /TAXON_ID=174948 /ORGANISM="Symbiodinium sp., Strain CCMP421" /LENGTH=239 /DNA_ID=CAMNT_0023594423 /DNA_START=21 /DNA_END=740 /DNA_ORIENTATION=+